ncbi:MAG: hypothetical protein ACTHN7_07420 [Solirubrobacterales bacterium]
MALVLALVASSCFPTGAGAAAHYYVLPGGQFTAMELEGSNDYRIRIVAYSRNSGDVVFLEAIKAGVRTEYEVRHSRVNADRVEAKLPGLGSISLRFHRHGPTRRSSSIVGCNGPRPTVRRGVVRGTIRFTGEREYTRVEAHEANAEVEEWVRQRCRYGRPRPRPSWTNRFQAWGGETPRIHFSATKYGPGAIEGGRVVFRASSPSFRGNLAVYRRAEVVAPASTFRIPEPSTYPEHLIIAPPAPFAGAGTFSRSPESVFVWEGDLSVQFPGIDPIPLTGPEITPQYCALRGCVSQDVEREAAAPRRARAG